MRIQLAGSLLLLGLLVGCQEGDGSNGFLTDGPQIDYIAPGAATVTRETTLVFEAHMSEASSDTELGVTWSLSGAGCTADACGTVVSLDETHARYTAPSTVPPDPNVVLTATTVGEPPWQHSAFIRIAPTAIRVTITPGSATLRESETIEFVATVEGDPAHAGVTWSVIGPGCGSSADCGVLSQTTSASGEPVTFTAGRYRRTADPDVAPVGVRATSVTDPSWSDSSPIFLRF
jgi:hypothetical protein